MSVSKVSAKEEGKATLAPEVESAKPKLIPNKPKDEAATKAASELFENDKKSSITKGGGGTSKAGTPIEVKDSRQPTPIPKTPSEEQQVENKDHFHINFKQADVGETPRNASQPE